MMILVQEVENIESVLQERSRLDELRTELKEQVESSEAQKAEHQAQIDQLVNELRVSGGRRSRTYIATLSFCCNSTCMFFCGCDAQ